MQTCIAQEVAGITDKTEKLTSVDLAAQQALALLKDSETRYRRLFETAQDGVLILNADTGVIEDANPFIKDLLGYPREELLGKVLWEIGLFKDIVASHDSFIELQKKGYVRYEDLPLETKDGRRKEVEFVSNAYSVGDKNVVQCNIRDITERKKTEAGLEKTRKELAVIKKSADEALEYANSTINTIREPLIVLDQDLRVVTASRSFYEFFKVKPEETVGQLIYDLGNKQWDIPKLRELLEDILPKKATFDNYEVEHNFATIGRRIMLLNARQIQRVLGKERIILLAIEDITERKEIEKELAVIKKSADEALEYANSTINTIREPLIVLDQDLRVVTASRSFYEFFKVKPEETVGQLIYDLGNKQWDIPKLRELLETVLPQKATFDNYEVEHDFSTIGRRIMLLNARQIQRVLGKERIILLAVEDITERKEIEAGLEKTRKELATTKISEDAAHEYSESIINTIREPLIALDQDLRVVSVSRSFYDFFKVNPKETVGQLIYDLGNKQWNIPKLRELLETILPQKTTFDNYEVEHNFATIGRRVMLLNARQIQRVLGKERIILLAIEDITERKEIEAGLEKTRKELATTKISEDAAHEYADSIINTIREPLIALDQDLRVVSVSRSFYEVFKVNPKETVGQLIYDLGNKQWDIPSLRELLETILPQKTTFNNYEVEHDFTGIGRRIMLLNARQIQRVLGKERIILLAIEDITERKEIEAGLEKTRKELAATKISEDAAHEYSESVINTVRESLISLDQDLRVVNVSRSFYEVFKVKPEETVGQLIYDLGNKQWDIPKLRELLETVLPQKATFDNYEVEHNFATIGRRIMLLNARQIQRASGKERIILLAIEDITGRKQAEELVRESEKRLNRAQEIAHLGSWEFDPVNDRLFWSDELYRIFGLKAQGFTATYEAFLDQAHPDDRAAVDAAYSGSLREGKDVYEIDHRIVRKSTGEVRSVHEKCEHIRDQTGRLIRTTAMVHDITERKQVDDELKRSNENLEQFAYVASHDLQEPLRVMSNYSQLLEKRYKGKLDADADDFIGFIVDAASRMQKLISDLLEYSRIGRKENPSTEADSNELVDKAIKNLSGSIKSAGATVTHGNLPVINVPANSFMQLFQNLIGNAVKFHGQEPPCITISAEKQDNEWKFGVHDNGIGIEPQYQDRIFQIFQRLHSLHEYPGTGIGLAICKKIVENRGGRIWVESQAGQGATFYFTIPVLFTGVVL